VDAEIYRMSPAAKPDVLNPWTLPSIVMNPSALSAMLSVAIPMSREVEAASAFANATVGRLPCADCMYTACQSFICTPVLLTTMQ